MGHPHLEQPRALGVVQPILRNRSRGQSASQDNTSERLVHSRAMSLVIARRLLSNQGLYQHLRYLRDALVLRIGPIRSDAAIDEQNPTYPDFGHPPWRPKGANALIRRRWMNSSPDRFRNLHQQRGAAKANGQLQAF